MCRNSNSLFVAVYNRTEQDVSVITDFITCILDIGSLAVVKIHFRLSWLALLGGGNPVAETNKGTLSIQDIAHGGSCISAF